MITNAIWGMIFVFVLHFLRMYSLPVAIGLCAAFALASALDVFIDRRR